jgi:hypothetical protein
LTRIAFKFLDTLFLRLQASILRVRMSTTAYAKNSRKRYTDTDADTDADTNATTDRNGQAHTYTCR